MIYQTWKTVPMLLSMLTLPGCNTVVVKTTEQAPLMTNTSAEIPETQLLDVGIGIFDPGTDPSDDDEDGTVFPEVRKAEARFVPTMLTATLQNAGAWGAVRLIPDRQSDMDLWVDGEILHSHGETLKLRIRVEDSAGNEWYTRSYEQKASKYAYDEESSHEGEPFQGLYNRIANDMLAHLQTLPPGDIKKLRMITELEFARRFSPEAFSEYLEADEKGRYRIMRLPAENDPQLERVRRIRERDDLFVDTLQDYYTSFTRQMQEPYRQWRKESYKESMELQKLRAAGTYRMVGGVLAVVGGIAAAVAGGSSGSVAASSAGAAAATIGIPAGALLFKSGLDKRAEADLHKESLREIAASLNAEIKPYTVALQDRTVTLTGTVEQQYSQWREILRELYRNETGAVSTQPVAPASDGNSREAKP